MHCSEACILPAHRRARALSLFASFLSVFAWRKSRYSKHTPFPIARHAYCRKTNQFHFLRAHDACVASTPTTHHAHFEQKSHTNHPFHTYIVPPAPLLILYSSLPLYMTCLTNPRQSAATPVVGRKKHNTPKSQKPQQAVCSSHSCCRTTSTELDTIPPAGLDVTKTYHNIAFAPTVPWVTIPCLCLYISRL